MVCVHQGFCVTGVSVWQGQCVCVKAALLTCFVFLPRWFFGVFVFRSSLSCSGLAGKFDAVLTCLLGMSSRHVYFYPERNMNGLMKLHWDSLILDCGVFGWHFSITFPCWGWHERLFVCYRNCPSKHDRKHVQIFFRADMFVCMFAWLVYGFACLFSGHPCHVSGLAYMFWFLAPLIVWHVCYPVISVMCRSCRRVLRNHDLFGWHV